MIPKPDLNSVELFCEMCYFIFYNYKQLKGGLELCLLIYKVNITQIGYRK